MHQLLPPLPYLLLPPPLTSPRSVGYNYLVQTLKSNNKTRQRPRCAEKRRNCSELEQLPLPLALPLPRPYARWLPLRFLCHIFVSSNSSELWPLHNCQPISFVPISNVEMQRKINTKCTSQILQFKAWLIFTRNQVRRRRAERDREREREQSRKIWRVILTCSIVKVLGSRFKGNFSNCYKL